MTFDHTAEAIFFGGVMIALIRWIGRTMREVSNDENPATGLASSITSLDVSAALRDPDAAPDRLPPGHTAPPPAHVPPVPATVHCPACGFTVTAAPQHLPFTADCPNCKRHVSVRGDGPGRLSVVVSEPRA